MSWLRATVSESVERSEVVGSGSCFDAVLMPTVWLENVPAFFGEFDALKPGTKNQTRRPTPAAIAITAAPANIHPVPRCSSRRDISRGSRSMDNLLQALSSQRG